MRYALLVAVLAGTAAVGAATASAHKSRAATPEVRQWGGTWIQSLDPAPGAVRANADSASAAPQPDQQLSDEKTFTRWANTRATQPIYAGPSTSSRKIGRLHWYTEDGFNEIYLLLQAHWDAQGKEWVQLRIPARPNGQVGWVHRAALGAFHLTHSRVVVNRSRQRMSFYDNGRKVWSAPVGVGKRGTPTPAGQFWVRERFKILSPASGYYPYAFGTSDYSTLTDWPGGGVVGIHGPFGDPRLIPGRISHGCIRLHVSDDFWLARHISLGTPVDVI